MADEEASVVLADGTVLDEATAKSVVAGVVSAREAGRGITVFPRRRRPSLTVGLGASPVVGFRLTAEVRRRAEEMARRRGITVSALAREALEDYLRHTG